MRCRRDQMGRQRVFIAARQTRSRTHVVNRDGVPQPVQPHGDTGRPAVAVAVIVGCGAGVLPHPRDRYSMHVVRLQHIERCLRVVDNRFQVIDKCFGIHHDHASVTVAPALYAPPPLTVPNPSVDTWQVYDVTAFGRVIARMLRLDEITNDNGLDVPRFAPVSMSCQWSNSRLTGAGLMLPSLIPVAIADTTLFLTMVWRVSFSAGVLLEMM